MFTSWDNQFTNRMDAAGEPLVYRGIFRCQGARSMQLLSTSPDVSLWYNSAVLFYENCLMLDHSVLAIKQMNAMPE